ncbi:hypothetical protein ABEB36_003493 [Hypothenemus hampei]|uniref:F-box domain-containing protein n=1 Tax=Hypothenemus hampei TaxID=57062 RepID=A0ABD1FCY9_HYPHA
MSGFGSLNEPFYAQNILPLVFPYLKKMDELSCARVCRLWYEIAVGNNVYASLSFSNEDIDYEYFIQRLEYYGTKHLTLKRCNFVINGKAPNCSISLPQLKTICVKEKWDLIISFLISVSPNFEELITKFSSEQLRQQCNSYKLMSYLNNPRNKEITGCLLDASSQFPWKIPTKVLCTPERFQCLSINTVGITREHHRLIKFYVNLNNLSFVRVSIWDPTILLIANNLVTLKLLKCSVPENLEQVLSQCISLKYLTIIPPWTKYELSDALHYNSIILKTAHRLRNTLKIFTWGFTVGYLRKIHNLYNTFTQKQLCSMCKSVEWVPIELDVFQSCPKHVPFVQMKLLEQHLRQQNWSASVNICEMKVEEV